MKEYIYKIVKRFLTWFGDIMLATQPPKTSAKQILDMQMIIQPGDVICRMYSYYLDSYIIPGEYSHSGFVISKDEIIHSVAEGIQFIHPIDFIKDTDGFIILRPTYLSKIHLQNAIDKAIFHVNNKAQYDFLFNDPNKFYCHEFTADCLLEADIFLSTSNVEFGFWPIKFTRTLYLASNLIEKLKKVYEFK